MSHEIELKRLLVGDRAAERLLAALGAKEPHEKRQVNHVFDTDDGRLNATLHALRLRHENDSDWILTAKGTLTSVGASTSTKLEAETRIPPDLADSILTSDADALAELRSRVTDAAFDALWRDFEHVLAGRRLGVVGSFENIRKVVPVTLPSGLNLELEIDRTRFPHGRIDDEVEIELQSSEVAAEVEAWLEEVTRAAGVVTAPSSPKFARFFQALTAT